jgi:hypothetical protein
MSLSSKAGQVLEVALADKGIAKEVQTILDSSVQSEIIVDLGPHGASGSNITLIKTGKVVQAFFNEGTITAPMHTLSGLASAYFTENHQNFVRCTATILFRRKDKTE